MDRLTAHGRFALMQDRSFLPDIGSEPTFPAIAVALAELAGWLDDAASDDDLREAATHGERLYGAGVVEADEIADVAEDVVREVMEWAERQGETCSSDS